MNADAAFITGKTHRVCQDYARADSNGKYVIVADGCSSSPDSDFGARLLVKSVENALDDPRKGAVNALAAARVLTLPQESLDATLLIAKEAVDAYGTPIIRVQAYGDGVVAAIERETGRLVAYHLEYPSGYPQYISYSLNSERQARLSELTNGNHLRYQLWHLEPARTEQVGLGAKDEPQGSSNLDWAWDLDISKYSLVAMFSDGISSVTDANAQAIPWQTILRELMDVPLTQGEFVQRQINWFAKECVKRKWSYADDFSMGAISL